MYRRNFLPIWQPKSSKELNVWATIQSDYKVSRDWRSWVPTISLGREKSPFKITTRTKSRREHERMFFKYQSKPLFYRDNSSHTWNDISNAINLGNWKPMKRKLGRLLLLKKVFIWELENELAKSNNKTCQRILV